MLLIIAISLPTSKFIIKNEGSFFIRLSDIH